MNEKGMTLIEALVALAILGIAVSAIVPSFFVQLDANTRNEERTGAAAAAQQVMEALRQQDPASMPASGASSPQQVSVGGRDYQVITEYCVVPSYCGSGSRHLLIKVALNGELLYTAETVYTQLR